MSVDLVVSCPECKKEVTVIMEYEKPVPGLFLVGPFANIARYCFEGQKRCECGKLINVDLEVIAADKE